MRRIYPITLVVAGSLLSLIALQPGLDYFIDSSSIDDLARGDLHSFFADQPLMGPLTLVLRAPFVRLVYHSNLTVVYYAGALPCAAALIWLAVRLWRLMDTRTRQERRLVALLCLGSVPALRALHWGHPEDILATALAVGAMLAAARGRGLLCGAMIGAAAASKQWGVLALLPALLVLPDGRRGCVAAAAGVGALFTLPMLLGDPERFWLVQRAASSVNPMHILDGQPLAPGGHVNPFDLWYPFSSHELWQGERLSFVNAGAARLAHPAILALGALLPALAWRRSRHLDLHTGLQLLALVLLLRCALDPMSLEYYHLPVVVALAAAAAVGGRRDLDFALLVTAGLTLAFIQPATGVPELEQAGALKFAAYLVTVLPATVWLAREVYALRWPAVARQAPLRAGR